MVLQAPQQKPKLAQITKFLSSKTEKHPVYLDLIAKLETLSTETLPANKFKQQTRKAINQFFEQEKKQLWQEINQRKNHYLQGNNPDRLQQTINQLPHRCNRLLQNHFRIHKQNSNQQKLELINPFIQQSLLHQVQNIVQQAQVITQQEADKNYLTLIVEQQDYKQSIHTHIFELCEQTITAWLNEEWQKITNRNSGSLEELRELIEKELQPLKDLVPSTKISHPPLKSEFIIDKYIELPTLSQASRIVFDYHYSQSTWFRLLVAVFIGSVIYLTTQRLFGFILLLVQIINLITGQDTKKLRLRQQTKELKRIVEGKYQFFVRFLVDKVIQDLGIALDSINQNYQEQLEAIAQAASQQLQQIKQANFQTKENIEELKQTQAKLMTILDD